MWRALLLLTFAGRALAAGGCELDDPPWQVLQADAGAPPHARAVWLDGRTLRWPGAPPDARYRLLAGGTAVPLRAASPDPTRAPWVAAGAELRTDAPAALRRAWHRGPLLLQRLDGAGVVAESTRIQHALAIDDLFAAAEQSAALGATVERGRTHFRLWAPTAQRVALCLYPDDRAPASSRVPLARDAASGVWQATAAGSLSGRHYAYVVDVHVPGTGLVRQRVTDPWSASLGADSRRSVVVDFDDPRTQPAAWHGAPRPPAAASNTDLVIYELHVRDFSRDDPSVPAPLRGRYGAFGVVGSHGMRHLRALAEAGLTDVHLLPAFDFATVPEVGCVTPAIPAATPDSPAQQAAVRAAAAQDCFNWGYDPWHFNAPEGSYASSAADGLVRVREFRAMVQALHAAGLRVGMDVVYNHTSAGGQDAKSVLDRVVPGYYHRLDAEGAIERSTCCANTATEHRMMARLMIDSAVLWVRHYRIDGFRFDLMGHQPRAAMERLQRAVDAAAGRRIPLIGEGWNFGEVADGRRFVQASQLSLGGSGIATFSDRARDALRGGGAGDDGIAQVARQGWLSGLFFDPNPDAKATRDDLLRAADLVRAGLAGTLRDGVAADYNGQPAGYALQPGEVVNYVENHDNQTLFDSLVFKLPPATAREDRWRVQLLGAAAVAFSQGVAYFHAGQELMRSKSMDRNSYDSGDHFNRLDWTLAGNGFGAGLPPEPDNGRSWPLMAPRLADAAIAPRPDEIRALRDAFFDLLRIRASTPAFRLRTAAEVRERLRFPGAGPGQAGSAVAVQIDSRGLPGTAFAGVLAVLNAGTGSHELTMPEERGRAWTLHPEHRADARTREAQFDAAEGRFTVPARTAAVFVLR